MTARIEQLTSPADLALLGPLWLSLHHHHQAVSDFDGFLTDDATSWQRRHAHYASLVGEDQAVVLLARDEHGPAGYALARLIHEPDNTFNTRSPYAELETLSVREDARSAGIGTLLLDRLDEVLAERGIVDMVVSVLVDNSEAPRFYRRRGLVPVETYLWRIGARRVPRAGAAASR